MITPERRAAIRALRAAITPGEWHAIHNDVLMFEEWQVETEQEYIAAFSDYYAYPEGPFGKGLTEANAAFIAAAPTVIDELLAENAELRALLHRLTRAHKGDCPSQFGRACTCGLEADQIQVRGLVGEMDDA